MRHGYSFVSIGVHSWFNESVADRLTLLQTQEREGA